MKLVVKTHVKAGKTLITVCDKSILGSVFEEDGCILDLSTSFYDGDLMVEEEVCDLIRNANIVNLAGDAAVKLGIDEGLIEEENVKTIEGVPFAISVVEED